MSTDQLKRFRDKVAVVTGAARGLGKRIAEAFVSEGGSVAMMGRNVAALEAAAAELGAMAVALPTDISDPSAVRRSFDAIHQRFGGVDFLVNNAAIGHLQTIEEAEDQLLQQEVGANLLGPIYCIRAAIPLMKARGAGGIVNVTSESVNRPYPFLTVYAATKSAMETLSAGLRTELRGQGIRITVLRSGRMSESGFNRDWPEERRARYREIVKAEGYHASSGEPISPQITARAVMDVLALPREANIDLLELRSSG
ncbi:meso-butanediol dehydrogenase/(S,S)-butanediol dehydrogenase/diacetyl reductase [Paraburkholderia sp. EB58]|uniref:SDR family oxidoreductase n=1 Tax=Paraburkholderia sp. EB58 TaxID=3035125 RepID=UPI003D233348